MNILQKRIDSFKNNLIKWPHNKNNKFAKPTSFAKAGFYFVRRPKAPDTVRCFMCDIEISYWRPNQSPFVRHGLESPQCAWRLLNFPDAHKLSLVSNYKANGEPRSAAMHAARLATFKNHNYYWPPKKTVSMYLTATKLAEAGFFFSPTATKPLRVKCAYCGIIIDSPSNNLDLLNEHQNFNSECVFFEHTHNTCTSSRREMDNVVSHTTFKTAKSSSNNDKPGINNSALKRRIEKACSSSNTKLKKSSNKRQKNNSEDKTNTTELMPVIFIEKIPVFDAEPFTKTQSSKDITANERKKIAHMPVANRANGVITKNKIIKLPPKNNVTSATKRKSLPTTSTSDTKTAVPSKRLRLNVVVEKSNTYDQNTITDTEPPKNKDKGQVVQYNLRLQSSKNNAVSLSEPQVKQSTASPQLSSGLSTFFNDNSSTDSKDRGWCDPVVNIRSQSNHEEPFKFIPCTDTINEPLLKPSDAATVSTQCSSYVSQLSNTPPQQQSQPIVYSSECEETGLAEHSSVYRCSNSFNAEKLSSFNPPVDEAEAKSKYEKFCGINPIPSIIEEARDQALGGMELMQSTPTSSQNWISKGEDAQASSTSDNLVQKDDRTYEQRFQAMTEGLERLKAEIFASFEKKNK